MGYRHVLNVVDLRWLDRASFLAARRGTAPPAQVPASSPPTPASAETLTTRLGAVAILFGGFLTGIWFIVIGWFLRSQAKGSFRQMVTRDVLQGTPVTVALRRDVHAVPPELSLFTLSNYVLAYNQRCYPVMSDDRLLGIVCLGDLQKYPRGQWRARSVSEVMTPRERLQVVQTSDDLAEAAKLMASTDVHQLPVMEDGHFAGFVTRSDIVHLAQIRSEMGRSASTHRPQKPAGIGR